MQNISSFHIPKKIPIQNFYFKVYFQTQNFKSNSIRFCKNSFFKFNVYFTASCQQQSFNGPMNENNTEKA